MEHIGTGPVSLQLREIIRAQIEEGIYPPGTAIPPENELAAQYDVNRLTVRTAIEALVYEGLLKRVQGKGRLCAGGKDEPGPGQSGGFTQTIRQKNAVPSTRILTKALRPAGNKYALVFGIQPEDSIYYIKRICYVSDEPFRWKRFSFRIMWSRSWKESICPSFLCMRFMIFITCAQTSAANAGPGCAGSKRRASARHFMRAGRDAVRVHQPG